MKIHWCNGDILLEGYLNIDIDGILAKECTEEEIAVNLTTIDNYFKYPFIEDAVERKKNKRAFIVDLRLNILEKWPFPDESIEEIVLISAWEHFNKNTEIPHLIKEINRVTKKEGKFIVSFPDIKETVKKYYDEKPDLCFDLIYCNWANQYAQHKAGYTETTFKQLFPNWDITRINFINHDYPMIQLESIKK